MQCATTANTRHSQQWMKLCEQHFEYEKIKTQLSTMATRKIGSHLNFVHNDEIWKDHVRHELQSLRKWPEQWGLMTREYTRLNRRLIGERLTPEAGDSLYPTRCSSVGSDQSAASSSRRSTPGYSSTRLPSILGSSHLSCSPIHPYQDLLITSQHRARLPTISTGSQSEQIPPRPFQAFPKTTSGEIGWQSSRPENNLEVYGRYAPNARGQHGILKLLDWPRQSIM